MLTDDVEAEVSEIDNTRVSSIIAAGLLGTTGSLGASEKISGTWRASAPAEAYLEFLDDGRVAGSDGCNRLMGSWTQEGDVIQFGTMVSTMMYCHDVDTWLSGLDCAKINGETMTILGSENVEIGTLRKEQSHPCRLSEAPSPIH